MASRLYIYNYYNNLYIEMINLWQEKLFEDIEKKVKKIDKWVYERLKVKPPKLKRAVQEKVNEIRNENMTGD